MNKEIVIYSSIAIHDELIKVFSDRKLVKNMPAQYFHSTIIKGLALHCNVFAISTNVPAKNKVKEFRFNKNIRYFYLKNWRLNFLNVIKNIALSFFITFFTIIKYSLRGYKVYLIADSLVLATSYGSFLAGKLFNAPRLNVCTDLPKYFFKEGSAGCFLNTKINKLSTGFIYVIESMKNVLDHRNRPYIVMEGMIEKFPETISYSDKSNVVLFTGAMTSYNGTIELIQAFSRLKELDFELHLYGLIEETALNDINHLLKDNRKCFYKGIVDNDTSLQLMRESYLLVSPRLTKMEYTNFSFPIKLLEYLSSGTAVLSTPLPCLTDEYKKNIFLFDDESIDGFEKTLREILLLDKSRLETNALNSLHYLNKNKSIEHQSKRIIDLMRYKL